MNNLSHPNAQRPATHAMSAQRVNMMRPGGSGAPQHRGPRGNSDSSHHNAHKPQLIQVVENLMEKQGEYQFDHSRESLNNVKLLVQISVYLMNFTVATFRHRVLREECDQYASRVHALLHHRNRARG